MKLPTSLRLVSTYILPHTLSWGSIPSKHTDSFLSQSHFKYFFSCWKRTSKKKRIRYKARLVLNKIWYKIWEIQIGKSPKMVLFKMVQFCSKQLFLLLKRKVCTEKKTQQANGIVFIIYLFYHIDHVIISYKCYRVSLFSHKLRCNWTLGVSVRDPCAPTLSVNKAVS